MHSDVTLKSKKQDILDAYNELLKKNQDFKKNQASRSHQQREKEKSEETIQQAAESSPEKTIAEMAQMKIEIANTIDELTSKLTEQSQQFHNLQKACELEQKQIEKNYEITVVAQTTEMLLEEHEKKRIDLELEFKNRKDQINLECKEQENTWNDKLEKLELEFKEKKEQVQKERKREQEEFEYQLFQSRKKDSDDYTLKVSKQERELEEKTEQFEKSWTEREKVIKDAEEELTQLRKQSEIFPKELEKTRDSYHSEGYKQAEMKYLQEKALAEKELEGQSKLYKMEIKSLNEQISRQENQIETLTLKLESSIEQVQQIANKAIEGASGTSTLQAVNKIAMEQAKGSGKNSH